MQFFIDKILQLRVGWNERPLDEVDFFHLCERFRVVVQETRLDTSGFYYRMLGGDFIVVDNRLAGVEKLAVLFHELGHFLLHAPSSGPAANFHGVGRRTRKEHEADIFALCAVIPKTLIQNRITREIIDDENIPPAMLAERLTIFERYGI